MVGIFTKSSQAMAWMWEAAYHVLQVSASATLLLLLLTILVP